MLAPRASLVGFALLATACSVSSSEDALPERASSATTALDPRFFDPGVRSDDVFGHANPDPSTMDLPAIDKMLADAAAAGSESAIVAIGDTVVPSTRTLGVRTTTPPKSELSEAEFDRISFYAFPHEVATFIRSQP